jgi:hypothetical protein
MMLLLIAAIGAVQAEAAPPPSAEEKAFEQRCAGHRFETAIAREVKGKKRLSRIHLCGDAGQTDAQWVHTLEDAIAKIEAAPGFSADSKTQAIEAIKDEIAKFGGKAEVPVLATGPRDVLEPSARVEYTQLPPLPAPTQAPEPAPLAGYTQLPPLPAPKTAATSAVVASIPQLARPQLTITCFNPAGFTSPAECDSLERETVLTVRADAAVPAGTALRFLRRGDNRAEVSIGQLARGKSTKFALPREVCAGVVESQVEIQVVQRAKPGDAGQVADTLGPYFLRC